MASRRSVVRSPLVLAALAVVGGAFVPTARAEDRVSLRLETLLPGRTLAFAGFEDIGSWGRRWKQTALSKLFADPEMQAFSRPIGEDLEKILKGDGPKEDSPIPPPVRQAFEQVQGLSGQAAVALVDLDDRQHPVFAANLDFGEHLRDFVTFLQRMKEEAGEHAPLSITEKDGRTWYSMGNPEKPEFVGTAIGTSVVVSSDKAWVDAVVASSGAAVKSALGDVEAFRRARTTAGEGTALFVFGNAPALADRLAKDMGPDQRRLADTLGLDTVKGVAYSFGFRGDVFRESMIIDAPGADHGIIPLLHAGPMTRGGLAMVPSTAFFYAEGASPMSTLLPKAREMLGKIDPEIEQKVAKALGDAREATGVDIEKDLLGALADEATYYLAMPETGGLYPEIAVMLSVKDPTSFEATAEKAVNGLLSTIGRDEKITASQRTIAWHGKRLHVIDLASTRKGVVPFTPTWAVLGDRWVVTLVPHAMKELILRTESGGRGLAGEEDFASILRQAPEGATSMGYVDTQALLSLLYDTAVPALQTALKPNMLHAPVRLDFAMLPATRTVRPYLRSIGLHSRFDGQSIILTIDSPVGYLLPLIAVAGTAGAVMGMRHGGRHGPTTVEVTRNDESNVMVADLQVRSLVEAVKLFQVARGSLPTSLGQLLQETDASTGKPWLDKVPTDPWGGAYDYVVSDRAKGEFVIRSAGPDRIPDTLDDVVHPTPSEK